MFGKDKKEESLGAVGGLGISKTNYDSVFDSEVKTEDLELVVTSMSFKEIMDDTLYILDTLLCKVYNEMLMEVESNKDYTHLIRDDILKVQCNKDYQLYLKIQKLNLPFFVIGSRQLSLPKDKVKITPHLDVKIRENTGVFSEKSYGSIMMLQDWWILTNDMLIIGLIDNRVEVHIGTPRLCYTILVRSKTRPHYQSFLVKDLEDYKNKEYCMTNFGREIIGLLLAGYRINHTLLGEILVPPKKYKKLKLKDYACAIMFFEYFEYWKYILEKNLVGIDFDFKKNRLKSVITTTKCINLF